ncbi:sensor histidine kinase [Actinophytocola sp.]|uniref:sensor histidine kinase n=1 Tax=Actinophytocola sp. TaxID=1872138 RepID=UPI002D5297C9|nr:histidine kinase [Actinophytocola sp.]HYQ67024.1 histidine kinase [Actinophytocola sp.]
MFADTAPLRVVLRRWPDYPGPIKDTALALVVTVFAFVPTVSHIGPEIGDLPARPAGAAAGLALTLALCVPLALRSWLPEACVLLIGTAFAIDQVLGYPDTFSKVGFLLSLYAAGAHLERFRRGIAVVMTAGYAVLAVVLHDLGSPQDFLDFLAFYLIMAVIWLSGSGVRRWRAQSTERTRLAAEVAASAERARIARDLHDVVTHHVTAMVVQADAAQYLLDSAPARAGEGLSAISETGRRALAELRALLGVLGTTGAATTADRTPTIGRVGDLVEQARMSGQPVEWTEQGVGRARSVEVELAAYRVVQETLTNAMKYATGRPTTVQVRHGEEHLEIEVTTAGGAAASPSSMSLSGGRGLTGLRERVRMLEGEMEAASRPDGGFRVWALIPSGSDA